MTTIDIDVDFYLDGAGDRALKREVDRRIAAGTWPTSLDDKVQPWTRTGLAEDIRLAFYRRDASRVEMLLGVLERHEAPHE